VETRPRQLVAHIRRDHRCRRSGTERKTLRALNRGFANPWIASPYVVRTLQKGEEP
jgi:hypothetical protein